LIRWKNKGIQYGEEGKESSESSNLLMKILSFGIGKIIDFFTNKSE
jgi:hypothetical protein